MFSVPELLDRAKRGAGVDSDYALAKALGHKSQANVSNWRVEKVAPDDLSIIALCKFSGDDPEEVAVWIRANSAANDATIELWKRIGARLRQRGFAELSIVAVLATISLALSSSPVQGALSNVVADPASTVYYVKSIMWGSYLLRMARLVIKTRKSPTCNASVTP